MIPSQTAETLNLELSSIYNSGGPQIAVLTLPSLEDQTIEERAIQVFDQWKIGHKGKDDGVLLLLAKKERKIRIEVGRGLEGDIPDVYAKRIIEDVMLPFFRKGQFNSGIITGVTQIAQLAHVNLKNIPPFSSSRKRETHLPVEKEIICWILATLATLASYRRRSGGGYGGGWGGGGGGSWDGGGGGGSSGGGASGGW